MTNINKCIDSITNKDNDIDNDFDIYQEWVNTIAIFPDNSSKFERTLFNTLSLSGECGEVVEKIKKIWRDKKSKLDFNDTVEILKELGDVLFSLSALTTDLGYNLSTVAGLSIQKQEDRKRKGTLQGKGDNR